MTGPRWWFQMFAYWTGAGFLLVALACLFGPERWFSAHSLMVIHRKTGIPWPAWGALFAIVPAGLIFNRTRLFAYCWGCVLAGLSCLVLLIYTVFDDKITNPIITGLAFIVPLNLLAGVRYAAQNHPKWRAE